MNPEELATCQCIIAHPSKPKFMAVKHTSGFMPPVVKVPPETSLSPNVARVVEGVQRKYGLRTTVLRQLARFNDYHCIELELHGTDSRRLEAVWVGLGDYARTGRADAGTYDPLADWLREREKGVTPSQRPPWERHGWFRAAEHWINFQLDRLGIQATGSVAQKQALGHATTILQVPTSGGRIYFKAAYEKAPGEVQLTRFLAGKWPGRITELLAFDDQRNWMLMPDFARENRYTGSIDDHAMAAGEMAQIQVEGVELLPELEGLGCADLGLRRLGEFLSDPRLADEFPELDGSGLTSEERSELARLSPRLVALCGDLAQLDLPATLVHPDFRSANFFIGDRSVRFIDWQNGCIAHPFFGFVKLLRQNHPSAFGALEQDAVVRAYLRPFLAFAPEQRLLRAMELVNRLQHAWRLLRWSLEFPWLEPGGVAMVQVQQRVTNVARRLLGAHRPPQ